MKKLFMVGVMSALTLPAFALETTTVTTTSPESSMTTTTTKTVDAQKMEESPAAFAEPAVSEPTTAPAVDALPQMGTGTLDQQRMEDPAMDAPVSGEAHRMDDPSIEDESGEYKLKIDDVDYE